MLPPPLCCRSPLEAGVLASSPLVLGPLHPQASPEAVLAGGEAPPGAENLCLNPGPAMYEPCDLGAILPASAFLPVTRRGWTRSFLNVHQFSVSNFTAL